MNEAGSLGAVMTFNGGRGRAGDNFHRKRPRASLPRKINRVPEGKVFQGIRKPPSSEG